MYHQSGPPGADGLDHGGVCILVKDHIGHVPVSLTTDLQAVAIQCHLGRKYTICSIYIPPNRALQLEQLENLISQLPSPFLILGDFNARHPHWGDTISNNKGVIIENLLATGICSILNKDLPTHFHSATNSFSYIDLSLCSPELLSDFTWDASEDLYHNDHFPTRLSLSDSTASHVPGHYIYEKADWNLFQDAAVCTRQLESFPSVDEAVEYFNSVVIEAADSSIPKTKGVIRTKPVPWWSTELRAALKERRIAMRRFYRTRLAADKITFNRARAKFHHLQRTAQRASWQRYVSNLNDRTPINKVWNMVKKIQGRYTGMHRPVLEVSDTYVAEPKVIANVFARNLSEVSKGSQSPKFLHHKRRQEATPVVFPDDDGSEYNAPFTRAEFEEALRQCSNTASGDDDIHYSMLKHLPEESILFLLAVYNRIWLEDSFPNMWRLAIVLPC